MKINRVPADSVCQLEHFASAKPAYVLSSRGIWQFACRNNWHENGGQEFNASTAMAALKDKIKVALDESRMLILGAQVLLGFAFRSAFEPAFERLPKFSQHLKLVSLFILLIAIGLLMAPGSYHRIVRGGNDAEDVLNFGNTVMDVALVPFLVALSLDIYVTTGTILGLAGGAGQAALIGATALFFWYGLGLLRRKKRARREDKKMAAAHPTELKDKIEQALTEARVVLPGVQALLGFQLITIFMDEFEKLPNSLKYLHVISLGVIALTMILLMTPAAYHRIAEQGEDTEAVHKIASSFLLAAMVLLPLGICADVFIVFSKVTDSAVLAT